MPYHEVNLSGNKYAKQFILNILKAKVSCKWVWRTGNNIVEALRATFIAKLVRGYLCLNAIHNEFNVPILHIYRDPRAVM